MNQHFYLIIQDLIKGLLMMDLIKVITFKIIMNLIMIMIGVIIMMKIVMEDIMMMVKEKVN